MHRPRNILVTGGAGFIGSNFIGYLSSNQEFDGTVTVLDLLAYAADPDYLEAAAGRFRGSRYRFVQGDICDAGLAAEIMETSRIDTVINFAALTHVDLSIEDPAPFYRTNISGTGTLLEAARRYWGERRDVRFHQVSTDEVFGSLGASGSFSENSPYAPRNPYSASKAAADHLVTASGHTYGIPVTVSCSCNNYGPGQHREKFIPQMLGRIVGGDFLPLYGDGRQVREWIHVRDHAEAIWLVTTRGRIGGRYAVGSGFEMCNIDLLGKLCRLAAEETGTDERELLARLRFVADRRGHDRRYALDCGTLRRELGWKPSVEFDDGLRETVRWYLRRR